MYRGGQIRGLEAYNQGASAFSGAMAAWRADVDQIDESNKALQEQHEQTTDLEAARNLGIEGLYQGLKPKIKRWVNKKYRESGVKEWDERVSNKFRKWRARVGADRPEGWKPRGGWRDRRGNWYNSDMNKDGTYDRMPTPANEMGAPSGDTQDRMGDRFYELPSEADERETMGGEDRDAGGRTFRSRDGSRRSYRRTAEQYGEKEMEPQDETKEEDPVDRSIREDREDRFNNLQLNDEGSGVDRYRESQSFQDDFMRKNQRTSKDEEGDRFNMGREDQDARERGMGGGEEESKTGEGTEMDEYSRTTRQTGAVNQDMFGDDRPRLLGGGNTQSGGGSDDIRWTNNPLPNEEEGREGRSMGTHSQVENPSEFRERIRNSMRGDRYQQGREGRNMGREDVNVGDREMETRSSGISRPYESNRDMDRNRSLQQDINEGGEMERDDSRYRPQLGRGNNELGQGIPTDHEDFNNDRGDSVRGMGNKMPPEDEGSRGGGALGGQSNKQPSSNFQGEGNRGGGERMGNTDTRQPTGGGERTTGSGGNIPTETPMEAPEDRVGQFLRGGARAAEKLGEKAEEGEAEEGVGSALIAGGTAADSTGVGLVVGVPLQIIGAAIDIFGAIQTGKSVWNWFDQDILGHHPKVPQKAAPPQPKFNNANLAIPSFDSVQDVPTSGGGW